MNVDKMGKQQNLEEEMRDNAADLLQLSTLNDERPKRLINLIRDYTSTCGQITTHQLRNIFAAVRRARTHTELQKLRPNIASVGTRMEKDKPGAKQFTALIEFFIERVGNDDQLYEFKYLMEAMVAYHKFHFGNQLK